MSEPIWLLKSAILAVHAMVINKFGGKKALRGEGLLDSALASPINLHHYENCTDLPCLAASYATGIIQNPSFIDGNKRTEFMAAYMFLDRNGLTLQADEASATQVRGPPSANRLNNSSVKTYRARHE